MKLAEALMLRGDLQKRINSTEERMRENIRHREDEEPIEDPVVLLETLQALQGDLHELIVRINFTNTDTYLDVEGFGEIPLSEALILRGHLTRKHGSLINAANAARPDRYARSFGGDDVKMVTALNVQELRSEADGVAEQIRNLNALVQQKNWETDLADA